MHQSVYLHICLVVTWLVPRETAAVSARSLYTIHPCTMSRHFMQSHIGRVPCVISCDLPPAPLAEWPGAFYVLLRWQQDLVAVVTTSAASMCHHLFWRFCRESTSHSLSCYALACAPNKAVVLRIFARYIICDVDCHEAAEETSKRRAGTHVGFFSSAKISQSIHLYCHVPSKIYWHEHGMRRGVESIRNHTHTFTIALTCNNTIDKP